MKHIKPIDKFYAKHVAPHAGAWIETNYPYLNLNPTAGRAPRGRVD